MKKITQYLLLRNLLLLGFLFVLSSSEASGLKQMKLDFKLGQVGRECHGYGICLIYDPEEGFPGEFTIMSIENNFIVLEIPLSKVKENSEAFNGEYFLMDEAYTIPLKISNELGFDYELTLSKGKHKLIESIYGYRIEFSID